MQNKPPKPPVHCLDYTIHPPEIERLKIPRFRAKFDPSTKEMSNVIWLDEEPGQQQQINTLKKAQAFLKHTLTL